MYISQYCVTALTKDGQLTQFPPCGAFKLIVLVWCFIMSSQLSTATQMYNQHSIKK